MHLRLKARAQEITGQIVGTITDASSARIVGAHVIIRNTDTGEIVRSLTTDKDGAYSAPLLQVGVYSVSASATGFTPRSLDHIEVNVSSALKADISLNAGTGETITVTDANNLAPDMENGAVNTVIAGSEMKDLALNTHNFEQLVQLQPGVVYGGNSDQVYTGRLSPSGQSNPANLAINGLRADQNAWLLDGADFLSHDTGTAVIVYPSIESTQQMKVLRNSYGAQYGGGATRRSSSSLVPAARPITATFTCTSATPSSDANDYFNNYIGFGRPEDNQYTGGLTVGGPVYIPHLISKSKLNTFFFYSLEVKRDAVAHVENISNVPTLGERTGLFATQVCIQRQPLPSTGCTTAGKVFQVPTINPVAQAYLKDVIDLFPAPNSPVDPHGLILDQLGIHNETQQLVRLDHEFSPRLSSFFRYIHDPINLITPNGINQNKGYPGVSTTSALTTADVFLLHATYALSNSTVVDLSGSYSTFGIQAKPIGALAPQNSPDIKINLPYVSTLARVPGLSFQEGGTLITATGPFGDYNDSFQVFGNIFHTLGRHALSAGFNWELYREAENQGTLNAGLYDFTSPVIQGSGTIAFQQDFADFLNGTINTFSQNSIDPVSSARINMFEGYIQDDWKALSRLTINAGVRYSFFQQPVATGNVLGSFEPAFYNPTTAPAIDSSGNICQTAPCPGGVAPNPAYDQYNGIVTGRLNSPYGAAVSRQPTLNFGPRVGFAWTSTATARPRSRAVTASTTCRRSSLLFIKPFTTIPVT